MMGRYLLRFDDICPTMNWEVWNTIEELLSEAGVRPIVAVVPDNRDESLRIDPPHQGFWDRVRSWHAQGWAIGLHGYQHVLSSKDRGLFGWDERSEFAGLSLKEQDLKIHKALEIFRHEGLKPDIWVAPNHSFDHLTLALLKQHDLPVVSDGLGLFPHRDRDGTTWVPMQMWGFAPRPFGVWTVCQHPNRWNGEDVEHLRARLAEYRERLTDLQTVLEAYGRRKISWADRLFASQRQGKRYVGRFRDRVSRVQWAGR